MFKSLTYSGGVQNALLSDIKDPTDTPVQDFFWFPWEPQFQLLNLDLKPGERIAFEIQVETKLKSYEGPKREYERKLIGPPTNLRRAFRTA